MDLDNRDGAECKKLLIAMKIEWNDTARYIDNTNIKKRLIENVQNCTK